jgi:hypothetical protein
MVASPFNFQQSNSFFYTSKYVCLISFVSYKNWTEMLKFSICCLGSKMLLQFFLMLCLPKGNLFA